MTHIKKFLFGFCLLLTTAHAQMIRDSIIYRPEVEQQFVEGMRLFKTGSFDSASTVFVNLLRFYPYSHRATGAYIMGAKAFYQTKHYLESIQLAKILNERFPQSSYNDNAHYTLGLDYYELLKYEDAAKEFVRACDGTSDAVISARSQKYLNSILIDQLTSSQLYILRSISQTDVTKALINLRLGEKYARSNDFTTAQEVLRIVTSLPASIPYVNDAKALLERLSIHGEVKIGVLLPLMQNDEKSSMRLLSEEFYAGMQLATDEFNQTAPVKVMLDLRDTQKDEKIAAQHVTDFCKDPMVAAILGPILSTETFVCAGIANTQGLSLISPTATATGIASVGPFVFQANPNLEIRGRAPADYAVRYLHAKRFAVLSPTDAPGKQMAEAFIDEVKKQGGELVDVEWYAAGTTDLRTQLMNMRRRAMEVAWEPMIDFGGTLPQSCINRMKEWGITRHVIDSLMESHALIPVSFLFGKAGKHIADSLRVPMITTHLKYDSLYIAAQGIDAIFIPINNSDEIAIVTPQLKYYNIDAQILGTSDWNEPGELDKNDHYTDSVIFFVDSYVDVTSDAYKNFVQKFQQIHPSLLPTQNVLIGYDVASMLLKTIAQTNMHRAEIAAALSRVQLYRGVHCQFSLTRGRVNSCLTVMQYKARQVLRIGEIDIAPEQN